MSFRYGYFDAHRTTQEIDGEQVVTYDRTYNISDFNDYFKYLIEPAGVFANSGDSYLYNGKTTYTKCKIATPSSADYAPRIVPYDLNDDNESDTMKLEITILTGKGMINGHWFIINVPEKMYLPDGSGSIVTASTVNYGVFVTYDESTRTVSLTSRVLGDNPSVYKPIGYNSAKKIVPNEDGVCELYLGYVTVYGVNSKEYRDGAICSVKNLIGSSVCPHISHLILPDGSADADRYVSQYQDEINDWIDRIKDEGGLNQHFDFVKSRVVDGASSVSSDINLTSKCGYRYSEYDIIQVYYNGLYLAENSEFNVRVQGNTTYLRVFDPDNTIPAGNIVDVLIIKGSTNDIPNGNNIKY